MQKGYEGVVGWTLEYPEEPMNRRRALVAIHCRASELEQRLAESVEELERRKMAETREFRFSPENDRPIPYVLVEGRDA